MMWFLLCKDSNHIQKQIVTFINWFHHFFWLFLLFHRIAMDRRGSQGWTRVLLKGQMRYVADIDSIIFLCSPLWVEQIFDIPNLILIRKIISFSINNLDELHGMGLYLNDLNPHGLSREMVLAGWQHCSRWKHYPSLNVIIQFEKKIFFMFEL